MVGGRAVFADERFPPRLAEMRNARRIERIGGEGRETPDEKNGEWKPETREDSDSRPPAGGTGRSQM